MKQKMNKKGDLLPEETAKIVIAVVCIIFLVILAFVLYNLFISKTRLEQGRANLAETEQIMNDLKSGESKSQVITNPAGFILTSWPDVTGKNIKFCSDRKWDNCLCYCEYKSKNNDYFLKDTILATTIGQLIALKDFYAVSHVGDMVYDACNKNSICFKPDKPAYIDTKNSLKQKLIDELNSKLFSWNNVQKAQLMQRIGESQFSISVNDLMRYGMKLNIKKNVNGYFITTE